MPPLQFIVARDRLDFWDFWTRWFSGVPQVQLFLDRRQGERRQGAQPHEPERRRGDRRRQPNIDQEIRDTGFAIIGSLSGDCSPMGSVCQSK